MIYGIILCSIIVLFLVLFLVKSKIWRRILGSAATIITLFSIILIGMNGLFHWGMVQETKSDQLDIYSSSPSKDLPLLIHQNINEDLSIYLYKKTPKGKISNTDTKYNVYNQVKRINSNRAHLIKRVKTWEYQSSFIKALFAKSHEGEFIEQNNTFEIPENWVVLTAKQSQILSKKLKQDAKQNDQMKSEIAEKVQAARIQNPQMSNDEQQEMIKKITEEMQKKAIQKAITEVKENK